MDNYEQIKTESASAKVTLGIRISPDLKDEINYEARELGQKSSEYGEAILHNRHKVRDEISKLNHTIKERDKTIAELQVIRSEAEKREQELAAKQIEVEDLKSELTSLTQQNKIFKDNRLLYLFEPLKGKKDIVRNAYGDNFEVSYDSPEAVLIAMIYSTKISK